MKTREQFKKLGATPGSGRKSIYGTKGDAKGWKAYQKSFDEVADAGTSTVTKTGDDLSKSAKKTGGIKGHLGRNYGKYAALAGAGYLVSDMQLQQVV